jgi:hypothetical protein
MENGGWWTVGRGIEQGMGMSAVERSGEERRGTKGKEENGEGGKADGCDHDELSLGEAADRR